MGRVLLAYGTQVTAVSSLWYLGKMLLSSDNDWTAVERKLWRAQGKLGWLENIFGREGVKKSGIVDGNNYVS